MPFQKGHNGFRTKESYIKAGPNISKAKRKYFLNQNYFNQPLDKTRAYWIGFLIADGFINRNSLNLRLKDKETIEKFKVALNYNGPIHFHPLSIKNKKHKDQWLIKVTHPVLVNSVVKFGIVPRKSFKTYVPKQIPNKLLKHFYRGLFDGDGCICKTKSKNKWQISLCGTKQIVTDFKNWINKQIKNQKGGVYKHGNIWKALFGSSISAWEALSLLYKNAPSEIRLERKYQKYLEFKEWREKKIKVCPYCGGSFYCGTGSPTICGVSECKRQSNNARQKRYVWKNKAKFLKYRKEYYRKNRERINQRHKEYQKKYRQRLKLRVEKEF